MTTRTKVVVEPSSFTRMGPDVWDIQIPVPPVPASRPRVLRSGHTYYGKTYARWMSAAERSLRQGAPEQFVLGRADVSRVLVESVCPLFKTVTRALPKGDVDNYAKAVMDVMSKVELWGDDKHVEALHSVKRFVRDDEEPFSRVLVTWDPNLKLEDYVS